MRPAVLAFAAAAVLLAAGVARILEQSAGRAANPVPMALASAPAASSPAPTVQASAAAAPATRVAEPPPPAAPSLAAPWSDAALPAALDALFGRQAVSGLLRTDDWARRVAVTVDALGRDQAASRLWPVAPAADRFLVRQDGGATVIDPDNALRYTPLVLLAETADMRQLVALYGHAYPSLQRAYEDAGFPHRSFHVRVLEVLDHLLAAPEPRAPVAVELPRVEGPFSPPRPWLTYRFVDPSLESMSAGWKIMVRVGPVNERRLKSRLAELRRQLAEAGPPPVGAASSPPANP